MQPRLVVESLQIGISNTYFLPLPELPKLTGTCCSSLLRSRSEKQITPKLCAELELSIGLKQGSCMELRRVGTTRVTSYVNVHRD